MLKAVHHAYLKKALGNKKTRLIERAFL